MIPTPPKSRSPYGPTQGDVPSEPVAHAHSAHDHAAPAHEPVSGRAIASLVLGAGAFLTGLIPFLGSLLGVPGLICGVLSIRSRKGRGIAVLGTVLAGVGTVCNLMVIVAFLLWSGAFDAVNARPDRNIEETHRENPEQPRTNPSDYSFPIQAVKTTCFAFDGPAIYLNTTAIADQDRCFMDLELWGERDADGSIAITGVGSILGAVQVQPVPTDIVDSWGTDGKLDGIIDYLDQNFIPEQGSVISLRETVAVEDSLFNMTRIDSIVETTQTKVLVFGFSPVEYETDGGVVNFFLISVTTPEDNGEEIIDLLLESWRWN